MFERLFAVLLAGWLMIGGAAYAQSAGVAAAEVKAAYLYNFAGFVTWPEETGARNEIVIGVLGSPEVEGHLRRIPAAASQNRPVSVKRITSATDVAGVHILFIGARENHRLARLLESLEQRPILTVTEAADGLEHGSVINLITTERVQFEISLSAAGKAGLQLNSRLLGVALRIKKGETHRLLYAQSNGMSWRSAAVVPGWFSHGTAGAKG
jgi:hypothetical protein